MNRKGYLPHTIIKGLVFWILSICILAATAAGILRSWGTIGEELAGRCLWTAFILAIGSVVFLAINCAFGDYGQMLFGTGEQPPSMDPAFSERLKKAKMGSPPAIQPSDVGKTGTRATDAEQDMDGNPH